jgi:hypothetical protein
MMKIINSTVEAMYDLLLELLVTMNDYIYIYILCIYYVKQYLEREMWSLPTVLESWEHSVISMRLYLPTNARK